MSSFSGISRRPPHGGRGLKCFFFVKFLVEVSRPPHGGRGLKFELLAADVVSAKSSSTRGTWIEISFLLYVLVIYGSRPPHGGRGLKSALRQKAKDTSLSSSTRGTWIEILSFCASVSSAGVVLHTGDVD